MLCRSFARSSTTSACLSLIFILCLCLLSCTSPAVAEVTWFGDVIPDDPATWTSDTIGYIGDIGDGTLGITGGSTVDCAMALIGANSGSTGDVTVDGVGSTWSNNNSWLSVGNSGIGVLNITNGGAASSGQGYVGWDNESSGIVNVDGTDSTWTSDYLIVGEYGSGVLNIANGGAVSSGASAIGRESGSTGEVTVDGGSSIWTIGGADYLIVGAYGNGALNIINGGMVNNNSYDGHIGAYSTGEVTVDGADSTWTNSYYLTVGFGGSGILNITGGGLVSVARTLTISLPEEDAGFINMATGGMLGLMGDADDSLSSFLGLIRGTGPIRYWDDSIEDWAHITGATYGEDYTLSYLTEGDLAGYTMLTVMAVPEPATMGLLMIGGLGLLQRKRN
jgi:T5SS/PEP-CTERM-associated repeat protein